MDMGTPLMQELEPLIDRHGLHGVLESLSQICYLKSAHVAESWQDNELARLWERSAKYIGNTAMRESIVRLPR